MLMTAEEARRRMFELTKEEEKKQLKRIESEVNNSISSGYIYFGERVSKGVKNTLVTLGYKVESFSSIRGETTKISWH